VQGANEANLLFAHGLPVQEKLVACSTEMIEYDPEIFRESFVFFQLWGHLTMLAVCHYGPGEIHWLGTV
jgi:hypothetical protein